MERSVKYVLVHVLGQLRFMASTTLARGLVVSQLLINWEPVVQLDRLHIL